MAKTNKEYINEFSEEERELVRSKLHRIGRVLYKRGHAIPKIRRFVREMVEVTY